jgi:hypothetical protein
MYSPYYYYVSCEAAGACLESGCSIATVIGLSVIVIDRGILRGILRGIVREVRGNSRGIDHGDGGGDVVEARIGSVNGGGARGIAVHKEVGLDMVVVVEVVGGIAFAAIVLGEGSMVAELVEIVADCSLEEEEEGSLEEEREDIQVVEACDLDCTVQLGSGSDSVIVGMEVLADCGLEKEIQVCDLDCTVQLGSGSDSVLVRRAGIEEEE